jgi:hypothetical protein
LSLAKISIALPFSIPQIACRGDYVMVNCLIDAVHKYIIKNMGTSRKRPSKINTIPSKRIKQPICISKINYQGTSTMSKSRT